PGEEPDGHAHGHEDGEVGAGGPVGGPQPPLQHVQGPDVGGPDQSPAEPHADHQREQPAPGPEEALHEQAALEAPEPRQPESAVAHISIVSRSIADSQLPAANCRPQTRLTPGVPASTLPMTVKPAWATRCSAAAGVTAASSPPDGWGS